MTVEQTTIEGDPQTLVNGKPLTSRQQHAFDLVRSSPYGLAADELGAHLHALKGRHSETQRCGFCAQEGAGVLRSQALKTLVTRRRATGHWHPRNPDDSLVEAAAEPISAGERATSTGEDYDPSTSEWPDGF